jgi:uncharacterized protein (TIGR03435 family)
MMRIMALCALLGTSGLLVAWQTPSFDVASIRVNRDPSDRPTFIRPVIEKGGRVLMRNQSLADMILAAYGIKENELIGGADWVRSTGYDLEARGPVDLSTETARAMLRTLLSERFSLQVHRERRDLPIFELRTVDRSGRAGPQLRPAGADCAPVTRPQGMPPPPPPGKGPILNPPLAAEGLPRRCPALFQSGHFSARAISMDALAGELSEVAGRPVVNRTGLAGEFDFDLMYTPSLSALPVADAATPPDLSTALRDLLGLRLETARGPMEVLVVDRVERPREN